MVTLLHNQQLRTSSHPPGAPASPMARRSARRAHLEQPGAMQEGDYGVAAAVHGGEQNPGARWVAKLGSGCRLGRGHNNIGSPASPTQEDNDFNYAEEVISGDEDAERPKRKDQRGRKRKADE